MHQRTSARASTLAIMVAASMLLAVRENVRASELQIGTATVSITPDRPVSLSGQMNTRISKNVESPVIATALALDSRQRGLILDQAILVSCDLVVIGESITELVRERLKARIPDFDVAKLILSATHTHTAPDSQEGLYDIPREGIMPPTKYRAFLVDRLTDVAAKAWERRAPGYVGWGMGHAVVAQNRRAVYADGHAQMYGKTDRPDFRRIEGYEDHAVDALFFWNRDKALIATAINVACPSQEVEGRSAVNADFWHEVREQLHKAHGNDLSVLAWTGAAGDQSPHLMFRERAEERMRKLRGLTRLEELARRIVQGWTEAYEGAVKEMHADVPLDHRVQTLSLPGRRVKLEEYTAAVAQVQTLSQNPSNLRSMLWYLEVVNRFERQKGDTVAPYEMEFHALRLGDVGIATNSFELFTDFGIQIKARSPALQTFIIQLAGPGGTYVPTERAEHGGGYSAIVESNRVGSEGGQVLVERTVELLNQLWPDR